MIKSRILDAIIDSVGRRILKVTGHGKNTYKATQASNFGVDSNPLKGMVAIYSETLTNGKPVIIGYVNTNQLAAEGETRLFSLDANGTLKTYLWLKNNGDTLIGGDARHLAAFEELKSGFDQLKSDFNLHVHGAPGTPPTVPSTASIDGAKTDKVKTA
jgi:hypothetical protein